MKNIIIYLFRIRADRGAKKVLKEEFPTHIIESILKGYWAKYLDLKPHIPREKTLGGRIMMDLSAMSIVFYRELMKKGKSSEKATRLFYDIAWNAYKPMGKLCWLLSGIGATSTARHLQNAVGLFTRFPFSSPSYQWQFVETEKKVVGFNCLRCPVAEYFKSHDLSELCVETWCNLDFPLAETWGAELERTGSIAGGADMCDFRFKVNKLNKRQQSVLKNQ